MSKKFSALAVAALASFNLVAAREKDLEDARERAEEASAEVVTALKTTPKGKAALVQDDGDVAVYTLTRDDFGYEAYKVETIAGDFEVPSDPEPEPVEPDQEPPVEPEPFEPEETPVVEAEPVDLFA